VHDVVTDDGFVLGVHRIPYRFNGVYEPEESQKENRPTVLLVHGATQTAFDFLAIGNMSLGMESISSVLGCQAQYKIKHFEYCIFNPFIDFLGFVLCDMGYDVWLMNYRGTKESSRHNKYTVDDREYWDWR